MPNFTIDQVRGIMDDSRNIRNMSVIAHVDHGKSTLTDSLIAAAGIIKLEDAGDRRIMDTRPDEQERTITIKSTGISLHFHLGEDKCPNLPGDSSGRDFLFNLIDSPGHVDFSSEVTAALRVTDGGLVVVDCVEGVSVQTETVLRQALAERIKPVMTINKLDRAYIELQMDQEEMYMGFCRIIENANMIISTYEDEKLGDVTVYPEKGTVAFSAGLHAWAFTLNTFARIYANKLPGEKDPLKLRERFWGDNFYDAKGKKWSRTPQGTDGAVLKRSFVQYILEPIGIVINAAIANQKDKLKTLLDKLGVKIPTSEFETKTDKKLMKACMQHWLPAHEALLEMMVLHLPSPKKAQGYRTELLYTGDLEDETAKSMRNCDKNGPLVVYISKMVPTSDKGRFYAFGRVFSGTVATGQKVRILGPNYTPGKKDDLNIKSIQRTVVMMGKNAEPVDDVPAGNTVAIVGIDGFLAKSGTLTSHEDSAPLVAMKFSVSPVVRVACVPKDSGDLPKLVEGLKRLEKSDPLVQTSYDEHAKQHIIAGAGELHLEICLKDLQEDFMNGAKLVISEPVVSFCETVAAESSQVCLSKSANKHNRLHCIACPLPEGLTEAIENNKIDMKDMKIGARTMADDFGMDINEARKIWAFGPNGNGPNFVLDATKGVQYLNEIKDSVSSAMAWVSNEGVLCGEKMRGIQFKLQDVTLHADAIHRGTGQVMPTARRVFYACQMTADPRIMEPIYLVDIQCPAAVTSGVYSCLNQRRGQVVEDIPRIGTPLTNIRAHLPVLESFGFTAALRSSTGGQAFPQCAFDHWKMFPDSPLEAGTKSLSLVLEARKRKNLEPVDSLPPLDRYLDKL